MPIISSFTGIAARGFGFTNGLPPLPPTDISFVTSEINAVVTFSTSPTSYPVDIVQAKIMQGATLISDWATVTSGGNISVSDLTPALLYTVYFRTRDTGGQISQEVSQAFTTIVESVPGAPTFLLAVASSDAGTFKFNITSTGGTIGTYPRTTQYRVETSAGAQLTDWTTISSNSSTVTAYGADTYNGAGALSPATTYSVRLRSVADTSGTITYAAYQTVTTNAIVAPNAPTSLSAAPVATGYQGEFSFTFSHTQGTARSYPIDGSQYRIRTGASTYLSGYSSYQQFTGTVSIGTSTYLNAILSPGSTYYVDIRTYDTQGNNSAVTSTSVTLTVVRNPNAPTSLSAAATAGTAGEFSFTFSHIAGTTTSYPVSGSQYRIRTGASTYLSGYSSYQQFTGTVSIGTSTYLNAILSPGSTYYVDIRTYDTQGNNSTVTTASVTTTAERVPGAPTFSLAVAAGDAGKYKFNITSTSGAAGSYLLTTQYRVETSAGAQLTDWTTISNSTTVTPYGADTSNGAGALDPATTYKVRLKSVAATSGTITYAAYQTVTTVSIGPNAPSMVVTPVAGTAGEFSFTISLTPGTAESHPISGSQYRIRTGASTYLAGYSSYQGITSPITIGTSTYVSAILAPGSTYYVDARTYDTQGNYSTVTTDSVTTTAERAPGAPEFSPAPASGDAGTFSFNITWTAGAAGSYLLTTQYRVETSAGLQLTDWTTISSSPTTYGASTYNGAGALSPNTTYRVRLKSVADTSGTITYSSPAYKEVTTNAIVPPDAPTGLSVNKAAGTAGEFSFTFYYTTETARSYPIDGSQYRIRTGASTYLDGYSSYKQFTGTVSIGTSTYLNAILSPGSTYYVDIRTYDTKGNYSAVTSGSVTLTAKRNPTVGTVTVAAPSYNGTNTTTLNVSKTGFTAGSWLISYYQYSTNAGTNWKTLSATSISVLSESTAESPAALDVDTSYTVYVRAVDTEGNVSTSDSGSAQTNAPIPAKPAFTSNGMSNNSAGTVNVFVSQPAYAERAFVQVSTSSTFAAGVTTYNSDTHTANFTFSGANSRWAFSLSNQAYGTTIYYRAYVRNRHGSDGESVYSTTRTWVTPTKNVPRTWSSFGRNTNHTAYTYAIPTNTCEPFRVAILFPASGIAATEDEPGYMRVNYVMATLKCGVQLKRPSEYGSNVNFQEPDEVVESGPYAGTYPVTTPLPSLCNTDNLRFSTATYVNSTTITSVSNAQPTTLSGTTPNLGGSDQSWYRIFATPVSGTSLHNKVFFVSSSSGKSWNSGCSLSLKGDYFSAKNIQAVGVETTPGSFS